MKNTKTTQRNTCGFTVVELLIATAVFSLVLMSALAGFLQIGRLFHQGVSNTQTQAIASQIFQDIVGNFQTADSVSPALKSADGYTYYCIGSSRYTYNIGRQVSLLAAPSHAAPGSGGNFGLLKDILPGSSACATPCDDSRVSIPEDPSCPAGATPFNSPIELLGDSMRLESFSLQPNLAVGPNFYSVSIVVAYGDDDLLGYTNPDNRSTVFCKGNSSSLQFCAISRLDTGVYKGQGR